MNPIAAAVASVVKQRPETIGDLDQKFIPRSMAQAVIDNLEPVQIDKEHSAGARPRLLLLHQHPA